MKDYMKLVGSIIMQNILIDLNVLLDYYEERRRRKYPDSVKAFDFLKHKDFAFISSSSIDNFEFLKYSDLSKVYPTKTREEKLRVIHKIIKEILSYFKIAKTPSYVEIDSEDIEDSLIIASAKAINGLILTRDEKLLSKYPDITISPKEFQGKYIYNNGPQEIKILDLSRETFNIYPEIERRMDKVIANSHFILGPEVSELEQKIARYIGVKHAIGVSSGTDALLLSLRALAMKNKGQEYWNKEDLIITTSFTFTATGDAILRAGATPLFVDIDIDTYNIDPEQVKEAVKKYGKRVRGIIPVHLYGQPCNMDEIMKIAKENAFLVVEDCAQSFGAKWEEKQVGSFGDTGCFSFFPSKNLGGFGDGGTITTDDDELAEIIRRLRKHGGKDKYNVFYIGYNARLDTLQAAILLAKMKYIDEFNKRRRKIASFYDEHLKEIAWLKTPEVHKKAYHVYHQYTIRLLNKKRDEIQRKLKEKGIQTMIYYPVTLHKMEVFKNRCECVGKLRNAIEATEQVLSLPIEPIYEEEIYRKVVEGVRN